MWLHVQLDRLCSFCQLADTPPHDPFSASFRSSWFDIFLSGARFPQVFEHFFSFVLFVLALLFIFACAKFLLCSGPKLEFLLFWSAFYARDAVLTAFLRVIRRFFLSVYAFTDSRRCDSVLCQKASMWQP